MIAEWIRSLRSGQSDVTQAIALGCKYQPAAPAPVKQKCSNATIISNNRRVSNEGNVGIIIVSQDLPLDGP
jgi:hypothetical protein